MNQSHEEVSGKFNILADQWAKHCEGVMFSSSIRDYLDHPAYVQLVALGKPVIPLIMKRYKEDNLHWEFVLDDITGFNWIKDRQRFSPKLLKEQWIKWWGEQINK